MNNSSARVLVVSNATEYVHESTEALVETVRELGNHFGWLVSRASKDLREFDNMELVLMFDVIFFAQSSGNIFDDRKMENLCKFAGTKGKGCVGFHAAADTHRNDLRFHNIFGACFAGHPPLQKGRVTFDSQAASELGLEKVLPQSMELVDEFYNFDVNLAMEHSTGFKVFAYADEGSYEHGPYERPEWENSRMGAVHPLAWYRDINGARSVYCALGHLAETYKLDPIRHILVAAINWAGFYKQLNKEADLQRSIKVVVDPARNGYEEFREELAIVNTRTSHFNVVVQYGAIKNIQTMAGVVPSDNFQSVHFIIGDATVDELYGAEVEQVLRILGVLHLKRLTVPEGEDSKSASNFLKLCDQVLTGGVDKHSTIITLGGGMVNNLAGMVAAVVYRGLRLVHIATSLLGQVDAATGIKQAVNWDTGKNQLGVIYAPSYVVIDTALLHSLPMRERINGLSEAIKHALCQDNEFLQYLMKHSVKDLEDPKFLHQVVKIGSAKKALCLNSTKESDYAEMCMQYGHAFGHAIEHLSNYSLRHGEAIAIGMTLCCEVAILLGHGDGLRLEQLLRLHQDIFSRFDLPWQVPSSMTDEDICDTLRHDKHYLHALPTMMTLRDCGWPYTSASGRTGFRIKYEVIAKALANNRARSFIPAKDRLKNMKAQESVAE